MTNTRRDIARKIAAQHPTRPARCYGVVTATHTAPATVDITLAGSPITGLRYLGSYTPTVGDTVVVDVNGSDVIILGTLAP